MSNEISRAFEDGVLLQTDLLNTQIKLHIAAVVGDVALFDPLVEEVKAIGGAILALELRTSPDIYHAMQVEAKERFRKALEAAANEK